MKSLFIIFSQICWITSYAQSVTIAHESASVEYYRMPDDPLPAAYTTYSAEVDVRPSEILRTGLTALSLEAEYLILEGYRKLSTHGDIHILASIGDFSVYGERRGTQTNKRKDKDGKETIDTKYYIELRYAQPVAVQVRDKKGKVLMDKYIYYLADDQTWRSPNYNSIDELEKYWRTQRTSKLAELQKNRIREGMKSLKDQVNDRYGFRLIRETERFEKIGRKRHPQYAQFDNALEIIKKSFKLMKADVALDEVKNSLQPAIDFYDKAQIAGRPGEKDHERLRHIVYYNQGLLAFWMEQFEEAKALANLILEMDPKDRDARRLVEQSEAVAYSLKKAGKKSRHKVALPGKA